MKTYRLFLEPDKQIPQFKRLGYEKVDVPLRDVLLKGCHPVGLCNWEGNGYRDTSGSAEALVERLNRDEHFIPSLKPRYSGEIAAANPDKYSRSWHSGKSSLDEELADIRKDIYFVKDLSHKQLLHIAWERLKSRWNGRLAREMVEYRYYRFSELRRFLKEKDATVKLRRRSDIEDYDLGRIVRPEDFRDNEGFVVRYGIGENVNIWKESALDAITGSGGLLSLAKTIDHFELSVNDATYNCERRGESIRAIPELPRGGVIRKRARTTASRFGASRYCFTASIEDVEKLLKEGAKVRFPTLDYTERDRSPNVSEAQLTEKLSIPRFTVPAAFHDGRTIQQLRAALDYHEEKLSGVKDELLERVAGLCMRLYEKHEAKLKKAFRGKYVRLDSGANDANGKKTFDILLEPRTSREAGKTIDTPLAGTVITMFILKHLRAERILDPGHENNTYGIDSLVRAILRRQVYLRGVFVQVVGSVSPPAIRGPWDSAEQATVRPT